MMNERGAASPFKIILLSGMTVMLFAGSMTVVLGTSDMLDSTSMTMSSVDFSENPDDSVTVSVRSMPSDAVIVATDGNKTERLTSVGARTTIENPQDGTIVVSVQKGDSETVIRTYEQD